MPTRLHFGVKKLDELANIAKPYGPKCLFVTTEDAEPLKGLFDRVKSQLRNQGFEVLHFDKVVPNPTVEIVEAGVEALNTFKADFVLAVGGGSTIDTAKTLCLMNNLSVIDWDYVFETFTNPHGLYETLSDVYLPLIAVPTTAGTGSEVTQAAVISRGHDKNTIFHPQNYSDHAILDPELLMTLPKKLTASTGFDAFSHAFESYINPNATPVSESISVKAMELVVNCLPQAVDQTQNLDSRTQLMHAQMLAGVGLANAGAAAPHPLSEIIGGITGISHGEALALVFPEFIRFHQRLKTQTSKLAVVARIFDSNLNSASDQEAALKLSDLVKAFLVDIKLYYSFKDYKLSQDSIDEIVESPTLGFLPFGSKDDLKGILLDSINNR